MALYNILYSSVATKPMNDKDLADLMLEARRNNQQQAITGLMLYHHGSFMQILEGEEYRVKELFKKICPDPRHRGISVYIDCEIEHRTFPDWSMGFLLVEDEHVRRYPGYSEFLENGFDSNLLLEQPTVAKEILTLFAHEQEPLISS